ncbi:hypothetical protein GCM10027286_27880 [Virgibacillus ainsalahensis]
MIDERKNRLKHLFDNSFRYLGTEVLLEHLAFTTPLSELWKARSKKFLYFLTAYSEIKD